MPPFVVVGEALVDIVSSPDGTTVETVGGSPMNVAVGLARLDVPALLVTRIGNDERGRRVADHLVRSGVVLADGSVVPGAATSTATARLDPDGAADYDFDLSWELPTRRLPESLGLHVGSLGTVLEPGRRTVRELVTQAAERDLTVSLDPNVRPFVLGDPDVAWRDVRELAASATLVKLSDEDLAHLRPGRSPLDTARSLLAGRTELVVVTRGGAGAWAATRGASVSVPAPATTVVDTVGAGDSFMAAALAAVHDCGRLRPGALAALDGTQLADLLTDAMAVAAVTCSRRGANPPTRQEVPAGWPLLR